MNASLIRICSASPLLCFSLVSSVLFPGTAARSVAFLSICVNPEHVSKRLTPLKPHLTCKITADFMVYFLWWKGRKANVCFGPGRIGAHSRASTQVTRSFWLFFFFPFVYTTACFTQQRGVTCLSFERFESLHYKFDLISAAGPARNKPEPEIVLNFLQF